MNFFSQGAVTGTHLGLRYMGKNGKQNPGGKRTGGIILNVASIQGIMSFPVMPVTSAAKAGVVALTRCLGHEVHYKAHGVKIMCLCPHAVGSPIMEYMPYVGYTQEAADYLEDMNIGDRQLTSDDVGAGIVKVMQEGETASVWFHNKSGDDPCLVENPGTFENILKNLKK